MSCDRVCLCVMHTVHTHIPFTFAKCGAGIVAGRLDCDTEWVNDNSKANAHAFTHASFAVSEMIMTWVSCDAWIYLYACLWQNKLPGAGLYDSFLATRCVRLAYFIFIFMHYRYRLTEYILSPFAIIFPENVIIYCDFWWSEKLLCIVE